MKTVAKKLPEEVKRIPIFCRHLPFTVGPQNFRLVTETIKNNKKSK